MTADPDRLGRRTEEAIHAVLDASRLLDLEALLQRLIEAACSLADAEVGALGVVVSPDLPLHPYVFTGMSKEVVQRIGRFPRPVGVLGEVALGGQTIRAADVRRHPAFRGFPEHHPAVTSLLGVPLFFEGRSVGVLYLGNRRGAAEFTDEDELVVKFLATHAGALVAQARLRDQLAAERAQLRTVFERAPHGIVHVAPGGCMIANPAADRLLGQPLTGHTFADYRGRLVRPDGTTIAAAEWPPTAPTEARVTHHDGTEVPVWLEATATSEGGGAVLVVEDISPRKEVERLREEFAAIVAHDLRNPVSTIQMTTEHCLRGATEGEVRAPVEIMQRIHRAAKRLGEMIGDLLDASRIEIHRVKLIREAVPLPRAVAALIEDISPSLVDHPVDLRVEGEPPSVLADPLRLAQILTNLVENAAKYSAAGTPIHVRVAPAEGAAVVAVEDFGEGISAEEIPRLFDRFYQSKRARERKTGLGLGLYITKGLVDAHGGRLWVTSAPGRGSTFFFSLPAAKPLQPGPDAHPSAA